MPRLAAGRDSAATPASRRQAIGAAVAVCRRPANLYRTVRIAVSVGLILTAINQADILIQGRATAITAVKIPLNFLVPFVVSNLGVLAGTRAEAAAR